MDAGVGVIVAFAALMIATVLEGGSPAAFASPSAALIIFGGTFGATMAAFSVKEFKRLPKLVGLAMKPRLSDTGEMRTQLIQFAERARRDGLLALEGDADKVSDPFVRRGLQMVIDGLEPDTVEEVLDLEIDATAARHMKGIQMLAAAGGYSPTMGVIGTVMGLVNVLGHLDDPSRLGESIATAFIATLIGVGMANIVWLPLSVNLKNKDASETAEHRMALVAILSIQAGDNPRIVAQKLQSFVGREPAEAKAGSGDTAQVEEEAA